MKISYENTLEDAVAFNLYHFEHSPTFRRNQKILMCVLPIVLAVMFIPLAIARESPGVVVFALVFGCLWIWAFPFMQRRSIARSSRKLYGEGSNKGFVCRHDLELTDEFLVEKSDGGMSSRKISDLEKVVTDQTYTYIYVGSLSAHVVPHERVSEGNLQAFVEELRRRLPNR